MRHSPDRCLLHKRIRSQAPFLRRRYPASLVLRACPSRASGWRLYATAGASRVSSEPLVYMPSPLPRRDRWMRALLSFSNDGGLPRSSGGSAPASPFSRPAQRSLHVTACALAGSLMDPLHRKLRLLRYLHHRSDCYRLERLLPGGIRTHWDRAPLHGTLRYTG